MKLSSLRNRRILKEFSRLLHKVLREAYYTPIHSDYEDYFQELSLKLLLMAQDFDGDPLGGDRYRFTAFAKRGLRWYLLDLIRSKDRRQDKTMEDVQELVDYILPQKDYQSSQSHILAFLAKAEETLTTDDWILFRYLIQDAYTINELAEIFQCSRQTITNRRKRIALILAPYKSILQT